MNSVLAWLASLPPATLSIILALVSAMENFLPPIPADVIVAFGSFLAARANRSPVPTIIAVVVGNVGGALAMLALGRRFGAEWIHRHLKRVMGEGAEQRVQHWYNQYGLPALFVSRFLPGVRAVVPPLAGAMRVPLGGAVAAIAIASAIWYTVLALIAYRLGAEWERIMDAIKRFETVAAIVAGAIVVVALVVWYVLRRRRRA
ncbi:MAG TPA: DedA family protein [Gemmatimonadaceae bacterium]|nr:DedA family protein [Gemmatimonadaceae bacterium]